MSNERALCSLCGEPMPKGEEMFKYHGYSGPCPKPSLPNPKTEIELIKEERDQLKARCERLNEGLSQAIDQLELEYKPTPLDGHFALIEKLKALREDGK